MKKPIMYSKTASLKRKWGWNFGVEQLELPQMSGHSCAHNPPSASFYDKETQFFWPFSGIYLGFWQTSPKPGNPDHSSRKSLTVAVNNQLLWSQ